MSVDQQSLDGAAAEAREQIDAALTTLLVRVERDRVDAVAEAIAEREREAGPILEQRLAALRADLEEQRAVAERAWAEQLSAQRAELERSEEALVVLRSMAREQEARVNAAEEAAGVAEASLKALVRQPSQASGTRDAVTRLLDHVYALDAARSLREVLDALAVALEREVGRA